MCAWSAGPTASWRATSTSLRTARKIFDGVVFPRPRTLSTAVTPVREDRTMTDYTSFDVAHIGNIELLTPTFDKSLWFFRDLLAMRVVAEAGDSVYLRTWDEYQRYTIKLTASDDAGVGRTTFRTIEPGGARAPGRRDRRRSGSARAGSTAKQGTGPTYLFRDPGRPLDGHLLRDRAVRRRRTTSRP